MQYVSNYFLFKMTKALHIIKFILNRELHKKKVFAYIYKVLCKQINFTDCEHKEEIKKSIFTYFVKTIGHNFIKQLNRIMQGSDQRPIPASASNIFKLCKDIYKKTYKK